MTNIQISSNEESSREALVRAPERMNPGANRRRRQPVRVGALLLLAVCAVLLSTRIKADTGTCNGASVTLPFTDVPASNIFFCAIAEAFFTGLTNGTSATTYSPSQNVPREQMAAFITRTLDQSLRRGSLRAALDQWWTPPSFDDLRTTDVGRVPQLCKSDGTSIWVANGGSSGTVSRVSRETGVVTGTWTGAASALGVLVAKGQVFITGQTGTLYSLDPGLAPGPVTPVISGLGAGLRGIAFDGSRIWVTKDFGVSAISFNPVSEQTFTAGLSLPFGILYDGANIWVTDFGDDKLKKLNPDGSVALSVTLPDDPGNPRHPAFDGTNIWVPTGNGKLYVVRAVGGLAGTVLATLTGNGLGVGNAAAFDGERILATNSSSGGNLSLWKASDLAPLGFFAVDSSLSPVGVCSDGINFWVALNAGTNTAGKVARF